jgi:hypothetical protein
MAAIVLAMEAVFFLALLALLRDADRRNHAPRRLSTIRDRLDEVRIIRRDDADRWDEGTGLCPVCGAVLFPASQPCHDGCENHEEGFACAAGHFFLAGWTWERPDLQKQR